MGNNLQIRPATLDDIPAITDIFNQAIVATTSSFYTEPRTYDEQEAWFRKHGERHPVLVAEDNGTVIGWASLTPWSERHAYRETGETSFYVNEENRGQGVGRALKSAIIAAAKELEYHTLLARVAEGSDESVHLNRSFGFELVGTMRQVGTKFGKRVDVHLFQLMLRDEED